MEFTPGFLIVAPSLHQFNEDTEEGFWVWGLPQKAVEIATLKITSHSPTHAHAYVNEFNL